MGHRSPFSPLRPAPTGCPVNRVISHTHLDSCESGPPHPSRPAPDASLLAPRIPLVFLCGLRFDGFSELLAPGKSGSSPWMPLFRLCPFSLWPDPSALAPSSTGTVSSLLSQCPCSGLALPLQPCPWGTCSVLTGPRWAPPRLAPDEGALSAPCPRPWLVSKSWPLGVKMLPFSQPETMSGQQNNLPHTGARSSQSLNVWAHWLLCQPPAQSSPHSRPTLCPSPHSPSGAVSAPGGTGAGHLFLGFGC